MNLDRDELDELLGAYAADALDDRTRRDVEQGLQHHPDLQVRTDRLRAALAPLGHLTVEPPPAHLADRLIARALEARQPGRPVDDGADASLRETYAEVCDNLRELVADLPTDAGSQRTVYGIDVASLIAHLAAVEDMIGDRLGLWPATVDVSDGHIPMGTTAPVATLQESLAAWDHRASAILRRIGELCENDLNRRVDLHGMQFDVREMLTIRAFEVWSHTEDVCRAIGRPLPAVSGPVTRTMAIQAIDLLRFFMTQTSEHQGKTIRITLTGSGGGSWLWRLDDETDALDPTTETDATMVANASDFCRLFADRLDDDVAAIQRSGDGSLLHDVVELAPTFADYGERIAPA